MAAWITRAPFAAAFLKPLMDSLSLSQDLNSHISSALCFAATIEAVPDPDATQLWRSLPRIGKLAKSEGFKAKAALLALVGSIIGAGGVLSKGVLEDWVVTKATTEALGRVAVVERDLVSEYKASL